MKKALTALLILGLSPKDKLDKLHEKYEEYQSLIESLKDNKQVLQSTSPSPFSRVNWNTSQVSHSSYGTSTAYRRQSQAIATVKEIAKKIHFRNGTFKIVTVWTLNFMKTL